jgi:adenylate cyclase
MMWMNKPKPSDKMQSSSPPLDFLSSLERTKRTLVVVDVVESVRLMQSDEQGTIDRWRRFCAQVRNEVLPAHQGRLVKSLGDGLLLEFRTVPTALAAALDIERNIGFQNKAHDAQTTIQLRIGVHVAEVVVDDLDVYGSGVNLTARIAGLAEPGEIVVTTEVRDQAATGLDTEFEDMGECYMKHIEKPVRAFRVLTSEAAKATSVPLGVAPQEHLAVLAVVPFLPIDDQQLPDTIGQMLAHDIMDGLSQLEGLQLISRLSTARLRDSKDCIEDCRQLLSARFVLTGNYHRAGEKIFVRYVLTETNDRQVIWHGSSESTWNNLFASDKPFACEVAAQVGKAVVHREVRLTRRSTIPTLENFTLYIGGVTLMHRMSLDDFSRAHHLFEQLAYRLPRNAVPKVALAKWHLMRNLQGWSEKPTLDIRHAYDFVRRALDHDPEHAFAVATDGFLAAHLSGDLLFAIERCEQALAFDPQDAEVWRMLAAAHAYWGHGEMAESCALQALSLTPLDPTRFIFELVVGAAKLACGNFDEALAWANASMRRNRMHLPTHRLRVIALTMAGRSKEAHQAAQQMLHLNPGFRVSAFARSYPGRDRPYAQQYYSALRAAGLPN